MKALGFTVHDFVAVPLVESLGIERKIRLRGKAVGCQERTWHCGLVIRSSEIEAFLYMGK